AASVSALGALPLLLTSPVSSAAEAIFVGCSVGSMNTAGAAELPPETLETVPHRVRREPYCTGVGPAPNAALAIPYIAFSGLLPVSFCDMAGMTTPLTPASVGTVALDLMPRRIAESEWNASPRLASTNVVLVGSMLPGSPNLE